MEGVTIIDTIYRMEYSSPWVLYIIAGIAVAYFIAAIISAMDNLPTLAVILTCLGLAFLIILLIVASLMPKVPTGNITAYRVLIDDNVKMSEFLQHYEIIKQEGLTYLVKPIS